tara:strand:- start:1158 stop:1436 length:279 start_codon:yes stop_codon:yes gene_type:complete
MFRSIKNSIDMFFEKETTKPMYTMGLLINIWEKEVGLSIKNNTKIIAYKNKTLIIKTTTPIWKNELLFQKEQLLTKLNTNQNKTIIKDIKFI